MDVFLAREELFVFDHTLVIFVMHFVDISEILQKKLQVERMLIL